MQITSNKGIMIGTLLLSAMVGVATSYKPQLVIALSLAFLIWFFLIKKRASILFYLMPLGIITFLPSDFVAINISTQIGVIKYSVATIVFMVLVTLIIKARSFEIERLRSNVVLFLLLFSLLLVNILSFVINNNSATQIMSVLDIFILSSGLLFLMLVVRPNNSLRTLKIAVYFSVLVTVIGIIEFIGIQPYLQLYTLGGQTFYYNNTIRDGLPRIVSTLGNPLILSIFLLFFLPVIIYLRELADKTFKWNLVLLLNLMGIALTMSRSAILIAIVILIFNLFRVNLKSFVKSVSVIGFFVFLFYMIITFLQLNQMISDRLLFKSQSESFTYRSQAFDAISYIMTNGNAFLGMGVGNVNDFLRSFGGTLVAHNNLDNVFLDTLASSGLIGLLVLSIILISLFFKFRQMEKLLRRVGYSLLLIFVGMGFSFDLLNYEAVWGVFWIIVGLLLNLNHQNKKNFEQLIGS